MWKELETFELENCNGGNSRHKIRFFEWLSDFFYDCACLFK